MRMCIESRRGDIVDGCGLTAVDFMRRLGKLVCDVGQRVSLYVVGQVDTAVRVSKGGVYI